MSSTPSLTPPTVEHGASAASAQVVPSAEEVEEEAPSLLARLRDADAVTRRQTQEWQERIGTLWGPEPAYHPQPEDASTWLLGRFFYTWIGDLMRLASAEALTAEQLPGPTRLCRAANAGRALSREIERQRSERRRWQAYASAGVRVRLTGGRGGDGVLRYVGPVWQLTEDSGELFAGIAWRAVPVRPASIQQRRAGRPVSAGCLLDSGVVEGEHLFDLRPGEVVASVERLGDVELCVPDEPVAEGSAREAAAGGLSVDAETPASARGRRPKPFGIGKGLVRSLGWHLLPTVPYCLIKNAMTLISPMVLRAYISYVERMVAASTAGGDGGGGENSSGLGSSSSLSSSSAFASTSTTSWLPSSTTAFVSAAASFLVDSPALFSTVSGRAGAGGSDPVLPSHSLFSSSTTSAAFSPSFASSSSVSSEPSPAVPVFTSATLTHGLLLSVLLFAVLLCESMATNRFSLLCNRTRYVCKHAVIALLFEKCLTISGRSLADPAMSAGRLVNMMSGDVDRIASFVQMFWSLVSAPIVLVVAMVLLHNLVGWAAFVGVGVLVLFMPLQGFMMVFMFRTYRAKAQATDARIKATSEFISGIRVVKFMSWEPSFVLDIEKKRREELRLLRKIQYMYMLISGFMNAAPSVVVASVFFTYSTMGRPLTPSVVFPVITLLWILEMPLFMIPMSAQMVLRCAVAARRVNRFLDCDDTDPSAITDPFQEPSDPDEDRAREEQELEEACWRQATAVWFRKAELTAYVPVKLTHPKKAYAAEGGAETAAGTEGPASTAADGAESASGSGDAAASTPPTHAAKDEDAFYDLRPKALLREVSLQIPRGKLTVIVGATGSGKSTLLDSLVGAVDVTSGRVVAARSVAYVPQQPWIMNATLRDNVLFFSDLDEARLERALDCSQLRADLPLLADGLATEIGEKGINLSGGQKARVGLARAVYADKELYLLDDPLSALDAYVAEKVMRECVLGELAGKTRVLATHHIHVVHQADLVVVLDAGRVVFRGTPQEFDRAGIHIGAASGEEPHPSRVGDPSGTTTAEVSSSSAPPQAPTAADSVDYLVDLGRQRSATRSRASSVADDAHEGRAGTEADAPPSSATAAAAATVAPSEPAGPTAQGRLLTEEEMAYGAVSMEVYAKYIQACGGWCVGGLVAVIYAATELIVVSPFLWLSLWSTDAFGLTTSQYLTVYALLTVGDVFCSPARYLTLASAGRRAGRELHSRLLRSIACGSLRFFDTTPTGRILNRFSKDIAQLDDELPGDIGYLLGQLASMCSTMAILISSQVALAVLVLPLSYVYWRLMKFYNAANSHLQRITNRSHSAVFSILGETLSGRWTIEAFGKGNAILDQALVSLDRIYASAFMIVAGNKWLSVRVETMTAFATAAVAALGVIALHLPDLLGTRVGMLSLSLIMARRMSWVLDSVIMQVASVEADMNSVQRVDAYLSAIEQEAGALATLADEVAALAERQQTQTHLRDSCPDSGAGEAVSEGAPGESAGRETDALLGSGSPSAPGPVAVPVCAMPRGAARMKAGTIEFRHVDMRYREGLPLVLRDVSFRVGVGQKVGVVGRTGSGKSTLLLAFLRLVEVCGGEVEVCGRPARDYGVRELRQLFSTIPQDPLLFDGTVRSNVDPLGEASSAECWAALEHVGMAERVRGEEGGLDSRVAAGGSNFSVGQRQLLCLARALLKKGSAFLLMDEATANVDPALDRQIQLTVARTFREYTVITIAHRLHTVAGYDMILMMDSGRVVAFGPPRTLVSTAGSPFAELVQSMGEDARRQFMDALQP